MSMEKIPKFKTDEEAAKFWETHSFKDYCIDTKFTTVVWVLTKTKNFRLMKLSNRLDAGGLKRK